MKAINCHPDSELVLRRKSKRDGELLLSCSVCGEKYQCRDGEFSHPYQTKKRSMGEIKSVKINGRITESRKKWILENYESIQDYLDNGR